MKVKLVFKCILILGATFLLFGCSNNGNGDTASNQDSKLEGQWFIAGTDIQGGHTWDGLLTIDGTGSATSGSLNSSAGPVYSVTGGNLAIDATGKVTGTITDSDGISTQVTMQLENNETMMAGEGNATGNEDGIFVLIKKSSGFTTANLAGEWFLGGSDIQGNHTWDGLLTIDGTGAVTAGSLNSSLGPVYTVTGGNLAIDATGKVTGAFTDSDGVSTQVTMQMNSNETIMAGEGNATGNEDGIFVFIKKSSGFTSADLEGEWFLSGSDIQGNHTWDGQLAIDDTGTVTAGSLNSSAGPAYTVTGGDLAIDATGKVTGTITDSDGISTQVTLQMDDYGTIMAGEGNATGNEDGMFVMIKK